MRSPTCLKVSAPSSTLLRFLKSQSEDLCFFTSNSRSSFCFNDNAPRHLQSNYRNKLTPIASRSLSTTRPRAATVEASFLNLDLLWPRSKHEVPSLLPTQPRSLRATPSLYPEFLGNPHRYASSDHRPWLRRLWGSRNLDKETALKPDDIPGFLEEGSETSMFNLNRSLSGKASNELKLRCTEFDENGNVTLVNGEFKKSELIAKYGLLPRDLRKIDSSLLPHILIRPSAILINLLHLRALIKHNRVLVFDAYGSTDSYTQSVFMYDLEGKLRQREGSRQAGGLPYEFRALEAVLISVTSGLEGEFEGVREPVVRVLRELEEDIDRDKLRHLLIYSKKLGTFEQKAKLVRDAIDELLDADDDLTAMYLTEKARGIERGEEDHTEVEMLLESYHKLCDEIVQASGNLVSNIRNTEEIVKAILDANRNSLMLLDLKFSIGTLGIGSGAFIAALYGMNLKNFMEESDYGFIGVSAWSFVFAAIVCYYGLTKLRKVQRVSMWGEQGRKSRGSWRDVDPMPALPGESRIDRLKRLKEARSHAMRDALKGGSGIGAEGVEALPPVLKERRP
ncbi:MAG: magnesium ion transporter [Pycnora praestabilis]|nr:MAG: magnesium ion transporter [Pycnora praestabilis]